MGKFTGMTVTALWAALLMGCATGGSGVDTSRPAGAKKRPQAVAVLSPTQGSNVKGQVTFLEETEGLRVTGNISGLTPGKHGFHIHEKGDCSAPDATSAGGHFNPEMRKHGAPTEPEHHLGDLGNIDADGSGTARFERVFPFLTFKGTNSIVGRSVIVHAKPDDFKTQPTGDAGGRLACGVIEMAGQ
jgi:Cu-Zn family superoxide dismutase